MYLIIVNQKLPLPPFGETFYKLLRFCLILRNIQSFLLCFSFYINLRLLRHILSIMFGKYYHAKAFIQTFKQPPT